MVTFLWDEFVTHDFVRYMYKIENYIDISKPNLTYQKANNIAKKFTSEPPNRINLLIYKIEEKFKLIHYIYSSLFSKIYNRTSQFGIQNKNTFDFYFQTWKNRKQNGLVVTRVVDKLPPNQAKQVTTEVLSQSKDPKDYQDRIIHENEQAPIDFEIPNEEFVPTMVKIVPNVDDRLVEQELKNENNQKDN